MKDKNIIKRGKVVELVPKQPYNGYQVRYGLSYGKRSLANVRVYANDGAKSFTYFNDGISAIKETDNGTYIYVNNGELKQNDVEDTLLVIIPYAQQLVTCVEKIHKISHREAVLFMHEGDTVELSQSLKVKRSVYTVVRNGKKLFLVKTKE